jgi:hypothetical protein
MTASDSDPLPLPPEPSATGQPPGEEAQDHTYRAPELFLIGAAYELLQAGPSGSLTDRSCYRKPGVVA